MLVYADLDEFIEKFKNFHHNTPRINQIKHIMNQIKLFMSEAPDLLTAFYDVMFEVRVVDTQILKSESNVSSTFLAAAILNGARPVVEALIRLGVNVSGIQWHEHQTTFDDQGLAIKQKNCQHTPIGLAIVLQARTEVTQESCQIIRLLQDAGADPEERGKIQKQKGDAEVVEKQCRYLDDEYHEFTPNNLVSLLYQNKKQKVVLLGDSTIDNVVWVKQGESVVDQLKLKLPDAEIVDLTNDGFTTNDVLNGAFRNKVVESSKHTEDLFHPLDIFTRLGKMTHVVLSVGGNDLREELENLFQCPVDERDRLLFNLISGIQVRYITIVNKIMEKGIQPILMLQYTPDATKDLYFVYKLMQVLKDQRIVKRNAKAKMEFGFQLYTKHKFESRVSNAAVKHLQHIMQQVYRPILQFAVDNGLPVVDMCSSMNHRDPSLYVAQIEPSAKGGAIIATLLAEVIMQHDFSQGSKMYSTPDSSGEIEIVDTDPDNWRPHYNTPISEAAAIEKFKAVYTAKLDKDKESFPGKLSKSKIDLESLDSVETLFNRAKSGRNRSLKILKKELEWVDEKTKEPIVTFTN